MNELLERQFSFYDIIIIGIFASFEDSARAAIIFVLITFTIGGIFNAYVKQQRAAITK